MKNLLNEYDKSLIKAGSRKFAFCVWCGKKKEHDHHIVYRSHGNKDITVSLCSECHGLVHAHLLHFKLVEDFGNNVRKLYGVMSDYPIKIQDSFDLDGWVDIDEKISKFQFKWEEPA